MRSIAIINQKGGVGKTTTAVNLSAGLADLGQRTCLIDLDPQAHASLHLGVTPHGTGTSIYDVLIGNAALADVRCQINPHLWLVPSHINLAAAEIGIGRRGGAGSRVARQAAAGSGVLRLSDHRLSTFAGPVDVECPGGGPGGLSAAAASLPGAPRFEQAAGNDRGRHPTAQPPAASLGRRLLSLRIGHATGTGSDGRRRRLSVGSARNPTVRGTEPSCFPARIRRNIRLAEAPSFGQTIFEYAPHSNGAEDYRQLSAEVLEMRRPEPGIPAPTPLDQDQLTTGR